MDPKELADRVASPPEAASMLYGTPGAGKSMSVIQWMMNELARKYEDQPDEEFWVWLQSQLPKEDYEACRAQPVAFIRKLNAGAWRSHLAEAHAAEVARIAKGESLPGDLQVQTIDTEQAYDPDWWLKVDESMSDF